MIDILAILGTHYLADYVLQTRKQGEGKSSSNELLLEHIEVYTCCLIAIGASLFTPYYAVLWALINGAAHFVTDYYTSRAGKAAYQAGNMAKFWRIHAMDQFAHVAVLLLSYQVLS